MLNYSTIQTIIQVLRMFFDIVFMWILLYYTIRIVRNNSRTIQIFKGIILVLFIKSIATFFNFRTVAWLADMFVTWGFLAVIIIFQPEIRGLLERLGKSSVFSRLNALSGNEREQLIDSLVSATMQLSESQTGALITLEQSHSLTDYIKTGTPMNSVVTSELLCSIFVTSTPLHDGAVIIQGDRIACASAYFPPTNMELPSRYGARHRAAIGISEITDSITIIVSEETGKVSIAEEGKLTPVTRTKLHEYLHRMIMNQETDLKYEPTQEERWMPFSFKDGKSPVLEAEPEQIGDQPLSAKEIIVPGVKKEESASDTLFRRFKKKPVKKEQIVNETEITTLKDEKLSLDLTSEKLKSEESEDKTGGESL
jgi:uncharacterized protein (TIGR00159 family)